MIGPDAKQVNMLINTLALFLTPEEQTRVRTLNHHSSTALPYAPDLLVQGILEVCSMLYLLYFVAFLICFTPTVPDVPACFDIG